MTHFTALRTIVSCTSRFTPLIQPQRLFSLSTPSHTNSDHKRHPIFSPSANVDSKPSFGSDPYPIPLQSPLHHTRVPEKYTITESAQAEPVKLDEPIETLRARLVYQSRKRGIVEMELLLSTFIDGGKLEGWDLDQLRTYDRFLKLPDWDLYYYLIKRVDPPASSEWRGSHLIDELRIHTANRAKQIRVMPSLA